MSRNRFQSGEYLAALCLLLPLPLAALAKPPDLPRGLGVFCRETVRHSPAAESTPEKLGQLLSEPDPHALLLAPVEEAQRLTLELRLDAEGKRFLRMKLDLGRSPSALPALRWPEEKALPLPPVAPGW